MALESHHGDPTMVTRLTDRQASYPQAQPHAADRQRHPFLIVPLIVSLLSPNALSSCASEVEALNVLLLSRIGVAILPEYKLSLEEQAHKRNARAVSRSLRHGMNAEKPKILFDTDKATRQYAVQYIKYIDALPVEEGPHHYKLEIEQQRRSQCIFGTSSSLSARSRSNYLYMRAMLRGAKSDVIRFEGEVAACSEKSYDEMSRALAPHLLGNLEPLSSSDSLDGF